MDNSSNCNVGMNSMMKVMMVVTGLHFVAIVGLYYLAMNLIVG